MTDAVPGHADEILNQGSPVFNPAGPVFATWLNDIVAKGAATHWTTLTTNVTATVDNHGRAFFLDGWELVLDPAVSLEAGWYSYAKGPGTLTPEAGEGDPVELLEGQWLIAGSDGTDLHILFGGDQLAVRSTDIRSIVQLTQSAYNALDPVDAATLYVIVE